MESAGEVLLRQGIEQGWKKGYPRGIARGLVRALARDLTPGIEAAIAGGVAQALEQGIAMGEANALVRLLERRFGTLPRSLRSRISEASVEQLMEWADKALDARSVKEVFREPDTS